jgi:hypothetical protein
VKHPHGVHCFHIHGWHLYMWCNACWCHWTAACGRVGCRNYERTVDHDLARQVVVDMNEGTLDIPAEILDINSPEVPGPWWQIPPGPSLN